MVRNSRDDERLAPAGGSTRVHTTTDLALMSYFIMRGLKLAKISRRDEDHPNSQEFVFYYEDPDDKATELGVDWINSEAHRFDNAMRSLKKLVNEARRSERRGRRAARSHRRKR